MAGGSEINNELTLDVSNFTQGLERATKKLDSFNTKLDSLDNKSEKLEKDFKDLSSNANQAAKSMGAIGAAGKQADDVLTSLVKDSQKAQRSFENMTEWTNHYGKSLDSLRPKMDALTKSQKELHSVTAKSTAEEAKAIQSGIQSRAKDLHDEQRVIGERIKARKQMLNQLEQLERRAETSAAYARADAYKTNKDGKEVARYRGKNASRQRELEAEIAAYQKEAQVIRQQKQHIAAIVGEMEYRNSEISKAIAGEKQLLQANEQQLELQRKSRQEAQKLAQEKKTQAREASQQAKQLARETAQAEKQAAKDVLATQRQAHKDLMAMKREELQMHKDMAALAAGAATVGATKQGVHQIENYQNVDTRVKAINLSTAEEERFRQKAWDMSADQKYLSRTDAMQTRLDALTAIGYNKEATIDKTVESAARNAYIMRSLGYEIAEFSDVVKNLYGFAEARQVMDDPNEVNRSFDVARRMGVASGGKIKMADVETVARNIGDLRQTMSAEGWVRLAAVMEQFKTAGGGNGGGGGVASVGTIFKMMSLYASGKPLTNGAAMKLLGADVMNEAYADGTSQEFKNTQAANTAFVKAVKFAGFKDVESMSKDPVQFFTGLRGQMLDYMMQDSQFKGFFGADAKKHSYTKDGKMIDADGNQVAQRKQDDIENAAFKRFFAQMGLSNKAIDGMLLTTNRAFAERSYHAADTALNSKDEYQMMEDLSHNWKANMDALKASMADFAVTFEPLLRQLSVVPKAMSDIVRGMSEFGKENPAIASLGLLTAGFAILKVAAAAALGPIGLVWRLLGTKKTLEVASTGAKAFGAGLTTVATAAVGAATAVGSLGGVAGKAKSEMDSTGKSASNMGAKSKQGFLDLIVGATSGATGVKGAVGSIMRVLGLLLNWAGWLALAGMVGWAVGKWISDMKVGGLTIGEHTQNLMNNLRFMWTDTFLAIRQGIATFFGWFGFETDAQITKIRGLRNEANKTREDLRILTEEEQYQKDNAHKMEVGRKAKSILTNNLKAKVEAGGGTQEERAWYVKQRKYEQDSGHQFRKDNAVAPAMPAQLAKQHAEIDKKYAVKSFEEHKKSTTSTSEKVESHVPETFNPGHSSPTDETGRLTPKAKSSRGEFVPQNAYEASLAGLKEEQARDNSRITELLGGAVDYDFLARQAFVKEWMQGKLDDGRDPSQRKFANRAYKKGTDWTEGDINWSDPKVQAWVNLKQGNLQGDGLQKSLEFAAGKLGESVENAQIAYENWNNGSKVPSDTQKARRDFAKFEAKNGTSTQNKEYQDYKLEALSRIAATNYAKLATELREKNKELNDTFLENDTQAMRNSEARRYETETNKINAVRNSLNEQINLVAQSFGTEDKLYKELVATRERAEAEITKNLEYQNKLRVENTRSAYDQTMKTWRDLETNLNNTLSAFGERAGTDIWGIITGDQDLDVRGYLSDMTKSIGGDFFKNAWGNASKALMGEGEGTTVVDMLKNFASGKGQSEQGWLGKYINGKTANGGDGSLISKMFVGAQGWLGKFFGGKDTTEQVADLTGDQAVNANTGALNRLTQALTGAAVTGGLIDTPVALPSSQAPAGVPIVPFEDRVAVDPAEGPATSGFFTNIFSNIKSGFSSIFNSDGEGGVFSKIKTSFTNLFSEGGGLMSKIGSSFSSVVGGIGSIFQSLIGGERGSVRSRFGGALSGVMSGFATGGVGGAITGGISGLLQSANGNAFGSSGHLHKFANGGAFTNGLFTSPTFFKFANGGSFSNGVMGEAGPEAVMPLQRDGSGRLGVAVNGGSGGMTNNVSINISVANDGSSSSEGTASGEGQQWKQMSNRVRMVVLEELVKQKRPGGALA